MHAGDQHLESMRWADTNSLRVLFCHVCLSCACALTVVKVTVLPCFRSAGDRDSPGPSAGGPSPRCADFRQFVTSAPVVDSVRAACESRRRARHERQVTRVEPMGLPWSRPRFARRLRDAPQRCHVLAAGAARRRAGVGQRRREVIRPKLERDVAFVGKECRRKVSWKVFTFDSDMSPRW